MSKAIERTKKSSKGISGNPIMQSSEFNVKQPLINPINSINPTNPINPINPTNPINPINPTNPINPINPTNPINPINPIFPINPIKIKNLSHEGIVEMVDQEADFQNLGRKLSSMYAYELEQAYEKMTILQKRKVLESLAQVSEQKLSEFANLLNINVQDHIEIWKMSENSVVRKQMIQLFQRIFQNEDLMKLLNEMLINDSLQKELEGTERSQENVKRILKILAKAGEKIELLKIPSLNQATIECMVDLLEQELFDKLENYSFIEQILKDPVVKERLKNTNLREEKLEERLLEKEEFGAIQSDKEFQQQQTLYKLLSDEKQVLEQKKASGEEEDSTLQQRIETIKLAMNKSTNSVQGIVEKSVSKSRYSIGKKSLRLYTAKQLGTLLEEMINKNENPEKIAEVEERLKEKVKRFQELEEKECVRGILKKNDINDLKRKVVILKVLKGKVDKGEEEEKTAEGKRLQALQSLRKGIPRYKKEIEDIENSMKFTLQRVNFEVPIEFLTIERLDELMLNGILKPLAAEIPESIRKRCFPELLSLKELDDLLNEQANESRQQVLGKVLQERLDDGEILWKEDGTEVLSEKGLQAYITEKMPVLQREIFPPEYKANKKRALIPEEMQKFLPEEMQPIVIKMNELIEQGNKWREEKNNPSQEGKKQEIIKQYDEIRREHKRIQETIETEYDSKEKKDRWKKKAAHLVEILISQSPIGDTIAEKMDGIWKKAEGKEKNAEELILEAGKILKEERDLRRERRALEKEVRQAYENSQLLKEPFDNLEEPDQKAIENAKRENALELANLLGEFREMHIEITPQFFYKRDYMKYPPKRIEKRENKMEHLDDSVEKLQFAMKCYPYTWWKRYKNNPEIEVEYGRRGKHRKEQKAIKMSHKGIRTAFHEEGHFFEEGVPNIRKLESIIYKKRTKEKSLQQIPRCRPGEMTRLGAFFHDYIGKDYGGQAYEIVSMGFERAYTNPEELKSDAEFEDYIYGILALM